MRSFFSLFCCLVTTYAKDRRIRFLIVGGINTGFSYVLSCCLYYAFHRLMHITVITSVSSLLSIMFSFLAYRWFVFQSKGNFFKELLRCHVVYVGILAILVCGIWLLVDFFNVPFWLAQLLLLVLVVIFAYLGHSRFTFAIKQKNPKKSNTPPPQSHKILGSSEKCVPEE